MKWKYKFLTIISSLSLFPVAISCTNINNDEIRKLKSKYQTDSLILYSENSNIFLNQIDRNNSYFKILNKDSNFDSKNSWRKIKTAYNFNWDYSNLEKYLNKNIIIELIPLKYNKILINLLILREPDLEYDLRNNPNYSNNAPAVYPQTWYPGDRFEYIYYYKFDYYNDSYIDSLQIKDNNLIIGIKYKERWLNKVTEDNKSHNEFPYIGSRYYKDSFISILYFDKFIKNGLETFERYNDFGSAFGPVRNNSKKNVSVLKLLQKSYLIDTKSSEFSNFNLNKLSDTKIEIF
ncbi:hypothetical protein BCF59_0579 [Mycoplasmopsis mustelae]|uniref:Lipoprotein n=1 Tax=Mycoplasmopsis mustelae TaxID=171289 RepID=A0A4R7UDE1_9BACT|nr:hypothetical protein [Mycoplasmopsis mustelae]TDV23585.1 hypothetical protein BCF59_0579 [Mycoplasmopsis mustelae]